MSVYLDLDRQPDYRFIAVNKGFVAIHPKPQGVIQFVGGFFFGGWFPQWWHKELLELLFTEKYTIIINVFANSSDHWGEAIKLVAFQESILTEVREIAKRKNYEYNIYELSNLEKKGKYFWLGHSLGCKYIALLELLTDLETEAVEEALKNTFGELEAEKIKEALVRNESDLSRVSIKNQSSILLAPVVRDFPKIIESIGLKIRPTKADTFKLIVEATKGDRNLFNLLAGMSLKMNNIEDNLAKETAGWVEDKIGGSARLLDGKVKKIAVNYPEFSWLPGPLKSLLAHLTPVFFSKYNNNELPKNIIADLKKLKQKLS